MMRIFGWAAAAASAISARRPALVDDHLPGEELVEVRRLLPLHHAALHGAALRFAGLEFALFIAKNI